MNRQEKIWIVSIAIFLFFVIAALTLLKSELDNRECLRSPATSLNNDTSARFKLIETDEGRYCCTSRWSGRGEGSFMFWKVKDINKYEGVCKKIT